MVAIFEVSEYCAHVGITLNVWQSADDCLEEDRKQQHLVSLFKLVTNCRIHVSFF